MITATFSPEGVDKLTLAIQIATKAHGKQRRRYTNEPYIVHPIRVIRILANELKIYDLDILCTAVLHDTLEDTPLDEKEIRDNFGSNVHWMVRMLTKKGKGHGCDQEYYDAIINSNANVRLIKVADRIDNIRDLKSWPSMEKREKYVTETKQYVIPIAKMTTDRGYALLTEALYEALQK